MSYNFSNFLNKAKSIETWLHNEYQNIRTGRASTSFLDQVKVESYGAMVPLSNVASIGIEDAKCIRVSPWDSSLIKSIEPEFIFNWFIKLLTFLSIFSGNLYLDILLGLSIL